MRHKKTGVVLKLSPRLTKLVWKQEVIYAHNEINELLQKFTAASARNKQIYKNDVDTYGKSQPMTAAVRKPHDTGKHPNTEGTHPACFTEISCYDSKRCRTPSSIHHALYSCISQHPK